MKKWMDKKQMDGWMDGYKKKKKRWMVGWIKIYEKIWMVD